MTFPRLRVGLFQVLALVDILSLTLRVGGYPCTIRPSSVIERAAAPIRLVRQSPLLLRHGDRAYSIESQAARRWAADSPLVMHWGMPTPW